MSGDFFLMKVNNWGTLAVRKKHTVFVHLNDECTNLAPIKVIPCYTHLYFPTFAPHFTDLHSQTNHCFIFLLKVQFLFFLLNQLALCQREIARLISKGTSDFFGFDRLDIFVRWNLWRRKRRRPLDDKGGEVSICDKIISRESLVNDMNMRRWINVNWNSLP